MCAFEMRDIFLFKDIIKKTSVILSVLMCFIFINPYESYANVEETTEVVEEIEEKFDAGIEYTRSLTPCKPFPALTVTFVGELPLF